MGLVFTANAPNYRDIWGSKFAVPKLEIGYVYSHPGTTVGTAVMFFCETLPLILVPCISPFCV
jgi:hypothetical protein